MNRADEKYYRDKLTEMFPFIYAGGPGAQPVNVVIQEIPAGTILLLEGDMATKLFLVIKGCLRSYFIKENCSEITSQFFIEGNMVMSFESVVTETPGRGYIDSVEDSVIGIIQMKNFSKLTDEPGHHANYILRFLTSRLIFYMNQHASFILENPETRYRKFLKDNPELVARLPLQYIASYLGVTPVSLSRIRSRIKKEINNC